MREMRPLLAALLLALSAPVFAEDISGGLDICEPNGKFYWDEDFRKRRIGVDTVPAFDCSSLLPDVPPFLTPPGPIVDVTDPIGPPFVPPPFVPPELPTDVVVVDPPIVDPPFVPPIDPPIGPAVNPPNRAPEPGTLALMAVAIGLLVRRLRP